MVMNGSLLNAMTIDVEDYYHVTAFSQCIDRCEWDSYTPRVVDNTLRLLDLLDQNEVSATFFVLGWVAERNPELVREIVQRGHELACHGYSHELIYKQTAGEFREDLHRAKSLLEDMAGAAVHGYRAPSYSITARSLWALDILIEEGFEYDSSIFPVHHDTYGIPDAKRFPHVIERRCGTILEFPPTTFRLSLPGKCLHVPISGGGYLRLFPLQLIRKALRHVNGKEGQPVSVYVHPWEIDPEQPRVKGAPAKSRFRHYVNLDTTESKVCRLLSEFRFARMCDVLAAMDAN